MRQLPPESATATARRNGLADVEPDDDDRPRAEPAENPWSQSDLLLAAVVDGIRRLEWMYASAHSKSPPRPPDPLPRPGVKPPKRKRMTVAQYRRLTGQDPPEYLIAAGRA